MEVVVHGIGAEDRYRRLAQIVVERIAHRIGVAVAPDVAMGHLGERMHAGIGAAGAIQVHRLAAESLQGRLYFTLHRRTIGLTLPANIGRAVIFQSKLVTGHASTVPGAIG